MLTTEIMNCIRESIASQMAPRKRELIAEVQRMTNAMAPRSGALSGNSLYSRGQAGCNELARRAEIIWLQIQRCYDTYDRPLTEQTVADLHQQLAEQIAAQCDAVLAIVDQPLTAHIPESAKVHVRNAVLERRGELQAYFENEARLYIETLRRRPAVEPAAPKSELHFHGPVGAVLTGAYATAAVHIDPAGRNQFIEALNGLQLAIEHSTELSADGRAQSQEVITELATAASAERPNTLRIRGLLLGLSVGIQTIAAAQPAWNAVVKAAIAIGAWIVR